ncbi:MAG TPA: helix-turn-helix domain-containing protein, partial [Thermoanaerobaculia bacterium]|nr:helix-turn-helix domain-containing protein [Thermoanaerobaculia bacterium]
MPPLSGSLTREEAAELLQLTPPMLDALLERGQLLCHYSGGQPRIPIAQLETFLRDSLVRLYRFEACRDLPAPVSAPAPKRVEVPRPPPLVIEEEPSIAAAPEPELEPEPERDPELQITI